jgi:membrane-bound acyltransferase YfiQ involved in biofilm formation
MDLFFGKIVGKLKDYTFAIYLLHSFVMDTLILIFDFNTKSILYRLGMPFIIIPICMVLTFIIRKIKFLKKIVP